MPAPLKWATWPRILSCATSEVRTTIQERRAVAGECQDALKYGIRTCVDEMDDAVNRANAAWPTRLYLVGLDGHVVYAGGLGPYGFKPAA